VHQVLQLRDLAQRLDFRGDEAGVLEDSSSGRPSPGKVGELAARNSLLQPLFDQKIEHAGSILAA
jgi:hypothetical protein